MDTSAGIHLQVVVVAAGALAPDASPPTPAQPAQLAPSTVSNDGVRLPLALAERQPLRNERGLLFAVPSWAQPPQPPAVSKQEAQLSASAGVSAGPVPYRFVGTVTRETGIQYALAKGDVLSWVKEGETLDDYRVEATTPGAVTLLYLPLGERTTLLLATAAPHNPSLGARLSTALPNPSPLAPELGAPQVNPAPAVEPRPALRAAQLRGPRNVTQ